MTDPAVKKRRDHFSPTELKLPYLEWNEIAPIPPPRDSMTPELAEWLWAWHWWDLACSPMPDNERRLIRRGHYLGWFDARKPAH